MNSNFIKSTYFTNYYVFTVICKTVLLSILVLYSSGTIYSQVKIEDGDPPNIKNIPSFYKSTLEEIDTQLDQIKKGDVKVIARSPGGEDVYAVYYGEKENFHSEANYNSAVAAGNPKYFAKKTEKSKPVIFLLGPVHGQEVEGIVGLINLIQIAETGKDYRGRDWTSLQRKMDLCRIIIVPCGNPDGRKRCPYNSFVDIPNNIMTKYGQGTHKDGTSWGYPMAKSLHPMVGDVGILGAYFNDDGINIMHDDFFNPMAKETQAILEIVRTEAPDISVSLHSYKGEAPIILEENYIPWFMKKRLYEFKQNLYLKFKNKGLYSKSINSIKDISVEDKEFPPSAYFNLTSAFYHLSGTMPVLFESPNGTKIDGKSIVDYSDILDIQLCLYEEIIDYIINNRLF